MVFVRGTVPDAAQRKLPGTYHASKKILSCYLLAAYTALLAVTRVRHILRAMVILSPPPASLIVFIPLGAFSSSPSGNDRGRKRHEAMPLPFTRQARVSRSRLEKEQKDQLNKGVEKYQIRVTTPIGLHMLVVMLAHFFLWHLKIKLGKKAPAITLSQLKILLEVVLAVAKIRRPGIFENCEVDTGQKLQSLPLSSEEKDS